MEDNEKSPLLDKSEELKIQPPGVDGGYNDLCPNDLTAFASFVSCVWLFFPMGVCSLIVHENETVIIQYWGKLYRTMSDPGVHCLNPIGRSEFRVSTKQRSIDLPNVKILDSKGNPIIVSAVVRYRVFDAIRACLEVEQYELFITNQAQTVLKLVCARYPYFTNDDSPSLKSDAKKIQDELVNKLQIYASQAGITIISVNLNELNYASEIAPMMLIRQQAEARIEARDLIVVGAVDIVSKAMQRLKNSGIDLPDEEKYKAVTSLLTVLCSDAPTQPVVTTL